MTELTTHAELVEATAGNSSFSRQDPGLQLAIDSTSLGAFKRCPRYYFYTIIQGWEPRARSHHLTFGILYHGGLERYDHGRSQGLPHDDSVDMAVKWVLEETWDPQRQRPWDSGDANKNRLTLVRTIIDYLDKFGPNDALQTCQLDSGKPAVELSFTFWSGLRTAAGEPLMFCGHLDRLADMSGHHYVVDRKTTAHTISQRWFDQFSPHNQFSLYTLAAKVVYKLPTRGLVVDGAQIAIGFSRFERQIVSRTEQQLEEWHRDAGIAMRQMETAAKAAYWPMNDVACDMFGGCPFRPVCSKPPSARRTWLEADFAKRVWDPLTRRGDI